MNKILFYRVIDHCDESYYEFTVDRDSPGNEDGIAESAADDFHTHNNGWESSWPLVFAIHKEEGGKELFRRNVDRDIMPIFRTFNIRDSK